MTFYFEVNIPSKSNKQKKYFMLASWKRRIRTDPFVSDTDPPDPDPFFSDTDLEHLELLRYLEIES